MNTVEAILILRDAAQAHMAMLHDEDIAMLTPNVEEQIEAIQFALDIVDKELDLHYKKAKL